MDGEADNACGSYIFFLSLRFPFNSFSLFFFLFMPFKRVTARSTRARKATRVRERGRTPGILRFSYGKTFYSPRARRARTGFTTRRPRDATMHPSSHASGYTLDTSKAGEITFVIRGRRDRFRQSDRVRTSRTSIVVIA